jgi:phage-related protein
MSDMTYICNLKANMDKPLVWLHGEVKTPPLSVVARIEAGMLLRRLQHGEKLAMPHSRPMPSIGKHCHELRINDADTTWRIVYRIDSDAIVVLEVFEKKRRQTPKQVIDNCKQRIRMYDDK